jgi:uncharacterized protein
MSAAIVIDSLEFARAKRLLSGELPLLDFSRLSDIFSDNESTLNYTVAGNSDDGRQLRLDIRVNGSVHLQCQRCLEQLDYSVNITNTLFLVPPSLPVDEGEGAFFMPDAPECIEASTELDVVNLIEDEVLLSLPAYPRHAEGTCVSRAAAYETVRGSDSNFAGLAALKNLGKSTKE